MVMKSLVYVASGRPGDWEAICLDLNIAVQGESLQEVQAAMEDAITTYVHAAMEESPETRDALLNRRVPFSVEAKYLFRLIWTVLLSRRRGGPDDRAEAMIRMPCPA
jgi:predicted RNase H-like HicB family nuclease